MIARVFRVGEKQRTPQEQRYVEQRAFLSKLNDEVERGRQRLAALKYQFELRERRDGPGIAEQFRLAHIVPEQDRVSRIIERQRQLAAEVDEFERAQDEKIEEVARRKILVDEVRRVEQQLKEAEFLFNQTRDRYRELRQELEAANA